MSAPTGPRRMLVVVARGDRTLLAEATRALGGLGGIEVIEDRRRESTLLSRDRQARPYLAR